MKRFFLITNLVSMALFVSCQLGNQKLNGSSQGLESSDSISLSPTESGLDTQANGQHVLEGDRNRLHKHNRFKQPFPKHHRGSHFSKADPRVADYRNEQISTTPSDGQFPTVLPETESTTVYPTLNTSTGFSESEPTVLGDIAAPQQGGEHCWFAVGNHFNHFIGDQKNTLPVAPGQSIEFGRFFNTAPESEIALFARNRAEYADTYARANGAVFLQPRSSAYIVNDLFPMPAHVSEQYKTFVLGSMAIPKGLSYQLLQRDGSVITSGVGPAILKSDFDSSEQGNGVYSNTQKVQYAGTQDTTEYARALASNSNIPSWMQQIGQNNTIKVYRSFYQTLRSTGIANGQNLPTQINTRIGLVHSIKVEAAESGTCFNNNNAKFQ